MGDSIRDYYRVIKGDTRSLDCSSNEPQSKLLSGTYIGDYVGLYRDLGLGSKLLKSGYIGDYIGILLQGLFREILGA